MRIVLLFGLYCSLATATTRTVKAGGGGDYTTIQACATAMAAGDTCSVYAGTYNEVVTVPAGSSGNYKTVSVNTGDMVNVYGFIVNSYTKVIGFNITRPGSPASAACIAVTGNATSWYVTNNIMYACGDGNAMIFEPGSVAGTGHGFIQGNTLSYGCSTSAAPNVCEGMFINGDYHLVENNDISHVSDGITNFGIHNVYRGNLFHDTSESDCGSNSSNCHIDFIESEPVVSGGLTRPTQYNLYEGNTIRSHLGANAHAGLTQGDACSGQCYGVIIRFNDMAHVGTYGWIDDNGGFTKIKMYNNTHVDFNETSEYAVNTHQSSSTGGAQVNQLFYYSLSAGTKTPYYVDSGSASGFTAGSNLAYCTGSCTFHGRNDSGSFASDATGNKVADPLFVSYAGNNFHLNAGSPAIAAGTYLTTVAVADSGSGTSLVVTDASFFQDGYGISGVEADWIRIGPFTTVQIVSVDYGTNTLALATGVSRASGDPVYLYKDSSGNQVLFAGTPDIGAYPYQTASTAPVAFSATMTGTIQ